MSSNKLKVVLTGGGTAGHVMPNLALVPDLIKSGFDILYIGSDGIEQTLVSQANIRFKSITCGKLRRYFSIKNLIDVFKVLLGVVQSFFILLSEKPNVVFSKGGFVAVPVCVAAWALKIPVISHESDYSPGLANKIISKFAHKILFSFSETAKYLPKDKSELVLAPIRQELFQGNKEAGLRLCNFTADKPVILVMGGSQGAQRLNSMLLECLPTLVKEFQIVHLTGKGKSIDFTGPGYKGFEFIGKELADIFAATDFSVCRAGANSIFELYALNIPMLLIPLEVGSRGDQILNAKSFEQKGWAITRSEGNLTSEKLLEAIQQLTSKGNEMKQLQRKDGTQFNNHRLIDIMKSSVKR